MNPPQVAAIGIFWFERETYDRARDLMADGAGFPAYAAWQRRAEQAERELTGRGYKVVRVKGDLDDFFAFCRAQKIKPDAHARTLYASLIAKRGQEH